MFCCDQCVFDSYSGRLFFLFIFFFFISFNIIYRCSFCKYFSFLPLYNVSFCSYPRSCFCFAVISFIILDFLQILSQYSLFWALVCMAFDSVFITLGSLLYRYPFCYDLLLSLTFFFIRSCLMDLLLSLWDHVFIMCLSLRNHSLVVSLSVRYRLILFVLSLSVRWIFHMFTI